MVKFKINSMNSILGNIHEKKTVFEFIMTRSCSSHIVAIETSDITVELR